MRAIQRLAPYDSATLGRLWATARMGYESRLNPLPADTDDTVEPTTIDLFWASQTGSEANAAFKMDDQRLKVCTIHSFKDWELATLVAVLPKDNEDAHGSPDILLYVAITRARKNLIVLNRNPRYHEYGRVGHLFGTSGPDSSQIDLV